MEQSDCCRRLLPASLSRRAALVRDECGQALVEFALVLVPFCLLVFGIVEFGLAYHDYVAVTDAARVGARAAAVGRYDPNVCASVGNGARGSAVDLNQSELKVFLNGVEVAQGSSCSGSGWASGQQVTVKVTYPYSINLLGMVVKADTLSSTAVERVE